FHQSALQASQLPDSKRDLTGNKSMELVTHLRMWEEIAMMPEEIRGPSRSAQAPGVPIIPPAAGPRSGAWLTIRQSLTNYEARSNPEASCMEAIIDANAKGEKNKFVKEVDAYQKSLEASMPPDVLRRVRLEA